MPELTSQADPESASHAEVRSLVEWTRGQMRLGDDVPWRVVWARTKLRKLLVEVEETRAGKTRSLLLKTHATEKGQESYAALQSLWLSGFRPPSPYTVVEPIAYLPERRVLVQEKAPGRPLIDFVRDGRAAEPMRQAARWLTRLHAVRMEARSGSMPDASVERWEVELAAALPDSVERVRPLLARLRSWLETPGSAVPCHGDFHPMNVFLDEGGRATAIDFDNFGLQEAEADVGYCLAQTALVDWFAHASFHPSHAARAGFLEEYRQAGKVETARVAAHIGMALIRGLHYDLCILKTGNRGMVTPFLDAAERSLLHGELV